MSKPRNRTAGIPVEIRRHARSRSIRARVLPGGVRVTAPPHISEHQIHQFLDDHQEQLQEYWQQIQHEHPVPEYHQGSSIPLLGRQIRLDMAPMAGSGYSCDWRAEEPHRLLVRHPISGIDQTQMRENLYKWYRRFARQHLHHRALELAVRTGISFNRLSVRDQSTRWGSCSSAGNLSLNWRLVLFAEPVIDYVIIHELAHREHFDHSPAFWDLVARHCPEYRQHRETLKTNPQPF